MASGESDPHFHRFHGRFRQRHLLHYHARCAKHRSGIGMVVGAGMQIVDEFGIHVVPEVRYTGWLDSTFRICRRPPTATRWKPIFR